MLKTDQCFAVSFDWLVTMSPMPSAPEYPFKVTQIFGCLFFTLVGKI